ncbi:MAG: xanthine dehydrogenase family protein molybdopterin-binding subunit [Solirubrobacteraceae bacterium]
MQTSPAPGLVGAPVPRHDGDRFLTGRARYTADFVLPAMLHAAVVRSPHAHARILSVDAERARALPGVHAVLTGGQALELVDEIPHSLDPAAVGGRHAQIRILAAGKVVYAGEPVAAVVAETIADAEAAAREVAVSYEPLPHVLDADEALAPGAPLLYEEWGSNLIVSGDFGPDDFDDVAQGSAHVLAGEVGAHRANAAPIEPRAFLADWDAREQRLTLFATTQNPHPLRATLAAALRLSEQRIRVVAPPLGGSFGLKMYGSREDVLVAALARLVGRPVRWVEDRAGSLLPGAHEQGIRYRVAFGDDGRLHALEVDMLSNHGAVGNGHGWGMALVGAMTVGCGYALDHCRVTWRVAATNKAPWGGTKPFGKDGATLVTERVLDLVAERTGLDPAEVRRRNFLARDVFPHTHPSGLELDCGDYEGALELALTRAGYDELRAEQRRRRSDGPRAGQPRVGLELGIGVAFELLPENADVPGALVAAFDTATVRMSPSGQATVLTGVTSPGSGSDTAIAQLVAGELGIALAHVSVVQGDTDSCPFGYGNLSSRSVVTGGSSAVLAARDVADRLRTVAGAMLDAPAEEIVLAGGMATAGGDAAAGGDATAGGNGAEGRSLPIAAVAEAVFSLAYLVALGVEPHLESTRTFRTPNIRQTPDAEGRLNTYSTYPYAVHVSVVELDRETGMLKLRRHVVAHDCGVVINPLLVDGQLAGGTVMGLGHALGEEFAYGADGRPRSTGFKTYLLARATDMPRVEIEHQVTPTPVNVLGAKGVGETGFAGAQSALLAAVNDALAPLGTRIDRTPLSPPNVLRAIREAA